MSGCLGSWALMSSFPCSLAAPLFQIFLSIYILCLSVLPILAPALLLAIQLLIRLSVVLDMQKITTLLS